MKPLLLLLAPLYRRRKAGLLTALLFTLMTVFAGVGLLGVSGWFLTGAALAGLGGAFNLFVPSALVRGLSFIRIASRYAEKLAGHAATLRLLSDLRSTVFQALIRLTPGQLARYRNGDLVARMTGDVDALDTVFLLVLAPLCIAALAGAALVLVFAASLPAAAWVLAVALLLVCLLLPWLLVRASRRSGAAVQQSAAQLRVAMLDAIDGHTDLVLLQATSRLQADFDALCQRVANAKERQAAIAASGQWHLVLVSGLSVVAILWFGLDALEQGVVSGPLLVGLLLAALGLFEVAGPIMRGAARMGAALQGAARIHDIASLPADLRDPATPVSLPQDGALVLDQVSFSYAGASGLTMPVLRAVDLQLEAGERIAIVGPSGAGKSTLLHLMLRLADPVAGRICFGGCDLRACTQAQLHQRIALLSQDAPVFLGSLRSNLLIGNPAADEAALWHVLESVQLAQFVRSLPDGLDTWTGETGANVSVGQARRLCLARALLSPAAVLVLDEPTSGLDEAAETAFLTDLARAAGKRSVILATHARLPEDAVQRVYQLNKGHLRLLA